MATALPVSLEAGEHCKLFASLYDGNELSVPDNGEVLVARHVEMTDIIDFSAQAEPALLSPASATQQQPQSKSTSTKAATFGALPAVGGQSVCFDRVSSGPTRGTDLVESLLPYALSVGSSTRNSSIFFVNNLGAGESPFHAVCRGETSTVYQLLAAMVPWMKRRNLDMDAALVAWDSWGDPFDLFANQQQEEAKSAAATASAMDASSAAGATTTFPLVFTGRDRLFDQMHVNRIVTERHSSSSTPSPSSAAFTGATRVQQQQLKFSSGGGLASRYKTVPELCDFVERKMSAFRKQISAGAFSKDSAGSSSAELRYAVCLRLDLVPVGADANDELSWGSLSIIECSGAMLCQARSSRRGCSPSLLSCVRSLFLPPEHEPIGWMSGGGGDAGTAAVASSTPLQALSDLPQRPELSLACALLGPTCNSRVAFVLPISTVCYGSSALFVQACVDAAALARKEWVTFPVPPPSVFSPEHAVNARLLANFSFECLAREVASLRWMLRRHRNCRLRDVSEGDEYQQNQNSSPSPSRGGNDPVRKKHTATSASAGYPNAIPILDDGAAITVRRGGGEQVENRSFANFSIANDSILDLLHNSNNGGGGGGGGGGAVSSRRPAGDDAGSMLGTSSLLTHPTNSASLLVREGSSNLLHANHSNNGNNGSFSIPAIDAWIIAMRRRLESLEEVESEQQEWQAWLEDYREWLLSVPASGPATQTILVPTSTQSVGGANSGSNAAGGSNSNNNNNSAASSVTFIAPQDSMMMKMTISWPERCELLERIVAQQQDELKRVKKICARDIENLREEVSLLRAAGNSSNYYSTTAAGGGRGGAGNGNVDAAASLGSARPSATLVTASGATEVAATGGGKQQQQQDHSVAYFTELRSVLQNFEFDLLALRNNAALPPEDASFEVQAMVDRLAHDVEAIVKPFIEESNRRGLKQRAQQLVAAQWELPEAPPDHQALFRHERLRLRALAGALARGCDDLASRIGAAVDVMDESARVNDGFLGGSSSAAQQQLVSDIGRVNDAASFLALASSANNPAASSSSAAAMRSHNNNNRSKRQLLEPEQSSENRAAVNASRYSHFVLSTVHQQWCRNVACSLRNSAEGVAQHLDRDIASEQQSSGGGGGGEDSYNSSIAQLVGKSSTVQDAAIAELCARFFTNRATRVIAGKLARDRRGAAEDETTALTRVLSAEHRRQAAAGGSGGDPKQQQQQLGEKQRVTHVPLSAITGKDNAQSTGLRSRFKKGLFSLGDVRVDSMRARTPPSGRR